MAFGKKKADDGTAPEALEPADELTEAFAFGDEASPAEELGALEDAPVEAAEAVAEAPAAEAGIDGADALLSMFQTTEAEGADRTALLELAGEVALDDLLEELHTVASALGITVSV